MKTTVYGLKNCDSCKKTMKHLEKLGADVTLLDVREHPPKPAQLKSWCSTFGRDVFVNKRSTTWRNLTDEQKNIESDSQAIELIQAAPALMKRPVVLHGTHMLLGHNPAELDKLFR